MSDRQVNRLLKGAAGFAIVYLIGWACYGDVAPNWVLGVTALVALIAGIVVYVLNPHVNGMDS